MMQSKVSVDKVMRTMGNSDGLTKEMADEIVDGLRSLACLQSSLCADMYTVIDTKFCAYVSSLVDKEMQATDERHADGEIALRRI
eukprot:3749202-Pyramimonas_sp.AAC.1